MAFAFIGPFPAIDYYLHLYDLGIVSAPLPSDTALGKQCSFCGELGATDTHPKYGWDRCHRPACNMAEAAHHERLIAGLVDCPETREDALRYAKRVLSV